MVQGVGQEADMMVQEADIMVQKSDLVNQETYGRVQVDNMK